MYEYVCNERMHVCGYLALHLNCMCVEHVICQQVALVENIGKFEILRAEKLVPCEKHRFFFEMEFADLIYLIGIIEIG